MARDYAKIAREFLRNIRGRRSQAAFSRRLGYSTNVAYVWESGRAFPTAAKTLAAARRAGIDLQAALRRFYKTPPAWLDVTDLASPSGVAQLLEDLRGRTSVMDLARAWQELEARRRSAYDLPWTQAVLRTLELTDYRALGKHRPGWIAARIGITPEQERECLELLAHTGQIDSKRGRWEPREVTAVDTRRDAEAEHRVKHWWSRLALERLESPDRGLLSYNVFAVSESDLARIRELQIAYFRQMRGIIAESTPSERVVIASLSLVALDSI